MAILNPPYIEEKLPAQKGNLIKIPFRFTYSVGLADISNLILKVKTISSNTEVIPALLSKDIANIDNNIYLAIFEIPADTTLNIGQFYKAQLALKGRNTQQETGFTFSAPGIFKFTSEPLIKILDINNEELHENSLTVSFIGYYENINDLSEKASKYQFEIFDANGKLYYTTNFLLHNAFEDTGNNFSKDFFVLRKDLIPNQSYTIRYSVITNNDLTVYKDYLIKRQSNVGIPFPGELGISTKDSAEEGYVTIQIKIDSQTKEKSLNGLYRILRTDETSHFLEWNIISSVRFCEEAISPGSIINLFKDYTITQGVQYKYAIQREYKHFFAKRIPMTFIFNGNSYIQERTVSIDYEHMFLYDGQRQLKIKYNPKVSNFKDTLLENKINTLGSQFPFFSKNGKVKYKEFSISGLISCVMDENNNFIHIEPNNLDMNLIYSERKFKLEVLEWLNNGKPKLFKSPVEGNYIIRLMNVNLSPVDTLGRLLHNFSAAAYEIDNCVYDKLIKYNFINNTILEFMKPVQIYSSKIPSNRKILLSSPATAATIKNAPLHSTWKLFFEKDNFYSVAIGYTNTYEIPIEENNKLISVESTSDNEAIIEYMCPYQDKDIDEDKIYDIKNKIEQYSGPIDNLMLSLGKVEDITELRITKKLLERVYYKDNLIYLDKNYSYVLPKEKQLSTTLYYYDIGNERYYINSKCNNGLPFKDIDYSYDINGVHSYMNNSYIDIKPMDTEGEGYVPNNITIGNGLYLDIVYYISEERSN